MIYDCVIVGGGAAGLCAGTYLGRFRRRVLIVDANASRMRRIPLIRNLPGWPDGVRGEHLHALLSRQAALYGARRCEDYVHAIAQHDDALELQGQQNYRAATILLASGTQMAEPDIVGVSDAIAQGIVRYCPICDGYEAQGKEVAVLARRPSSLNEALLLRTYTKRVTYLCETFGAQLSASDQTRAKTQGIDYLATPIASISMTERGVRISFDDSDHQDFDILYPSLGCTPQSGLLRSLGGALSAAGGVVTDPHQRTNVAGVYAAGDVLEGLDQIANAWGQAALAATAIHNDLRKEAA